LRGAKEGAFGIDDPCFLVERIAEGGPGVWILKILEVTSQIEFTALTSEDEPLEEQMLEAFAEDLHRKEEAGTGVDPAEGIGGESTRSDDAMNVGVMGKVLCPGVQDGSETDLGAEVTRISGDIDKGLGGGLEEEIVEAFGLAEDEWTEGVGKGEHHMEVWDGKDAGERLLNPLGAFTVLAFRAVSITA
jgi:hypothetical protein